MGKAHMQKKGQAAIEFLMTYGWMLLVVLIVGALIFSFVDFGSLLPNRIDMAGNVRPSAADSFATSSPQAITGPTTSPSPDVVVVFTYIGTSRALINATNVVGAGSSLDVPNTTITTIDGNVCGSVAVKNVDIDNDLLTSGFHDDPEGDSGIFFINGQTGIIYFDCSTTLLQGDVLEGDIQIAITNSRTNLAIPNTGPTRLAVN
jgi:hypothetical protein